MQTILVITTNDKGETSVRQMDIREAARLLMSEKIPAWFLDESSFALWLDENADITGQESSRGWYDIKRFDGDGYGVALLTSQPCLQTQVDSLAAYFFEGPFAGEYYGTECVDEVDGQGRLFFLNADFTKSRHDDWTDSIGDLWAMLRDGTPVRKTDRKGPGTKGTRAVEGLHCDLWLAFQ